MADMTHTSVWVTRKPTTFLLRSYTPALAVHCRCTVERLSRTAWWVSHMYLWPVDPGSQTAFSLKVWTQLSGHQLDASNVRDNVLKCIRKWRWRDEYMSLKNGSRFMDYTEMFLCFPQFIFWNLLGSVGKSSHGSSRTPKTFWCPSA